MDEYLPDIIPPDINIQNEFQNEIVGDDVQLDILNLGDQHPVFADVLLEAPVPPQGVNNVHNIQNAEVQLHIPEIEDPAQQQAQNQILEQNNLHIIPPPHPEIPALVQIQDEVLEAELSIKEYADAATLHLNKARKREHTKMLIKEKTIEFPKNKHIIVKPNQRIVINNPLFLGNTAHIKTKKFMNLEINSIRNKLTVSTLSSVHCPKNRKCSVCKLPQVHMEKHKNMGSFAPLHLFTTLDEHLQLELLFTCTLTEDNLGLQNKFQGTLKLYPHRDEQITKKHIEQFKFTGKFLPENIEGALAAVGKFPFCGEHKQAFNTVAAFLLHHVTETHTLTSHLCILCKTFSSDSPLQHFTRYHSLVIQNDPSLHKLAETFQNGKCSEIILEDIYTFKQSTNIRKTMQGENIHQTIPKLLSKFTASRFQAYNGIRNLFPLEMATVHSPWFKTPFPLHQMDMLIAFRGDANDSLYGILSVLERLLDGTPPTTDAAEFLALNEFEIMQALICARVQYEHNELTTITNPEELKIGWNTTYHLQPTGPHFHARNLSKLQDLDFSIYKIATVGQRMLKLSGLLLNEGLNILNLSNCEANLIPTSGYSGLSFFEDQNKTLIPIVPEHNYLNHIKNVILSTSQDLPLLVEFDILGTLQKIPVQNWEHWMTNNLESTILFFLVSIQAMLSKPPSPGFKPRHVILLGQHTLFHPTLEFKFLITLTNRINMVLSRAGVLTEFPILLPTNLVGINIGSAISLNTMPRTPVFLPDGENSEYTVQSIQHVISLAVDILDLKEDTVLFPAYRSHMVYYYNCLITN